MKESSYTAWLNKSMWIKQWPPEVQLFLMWFFLSEVHRSKPRTRSPPGCRSAWEMLRSMLKSGTKWQCVYFGVNKTKLYASHTHTHRNQQVSNRLVTKMQLTTDTHTHTHTHTDRHNYTRYLYVKQTASPFYLDLPLCGAALQKSAQHNSCAVL
jgi:hypothetical protein